MGASTSWKPQGLSRPVMGLLYHHLLPLTRIHLLVLSITLLPMSHPWVATPKQTYRDEAPLLLEYKNASLVYRLPTTSKANGNLSCTTMKASKLCVRMIVLCELSDIPMR
jgi:hypothetical protein